MMQVSRINTFMLIALSLWCAGPCIGQSLDEGAGDDAAAQPEQPAKHEWNPKFRIDLAGVGQVESDLDGDADTNGKYGVSRAGLSLGFSFDPAPRLNFDLSFGLSIDSYDFSGDAGFGALSPWETVHTWWVAPRLAWSINDRWTLWGGPRFVHAAESDVGNEEPGVETGTVWTAGGSVGFTWQANDNLHLGLGLSVQSQIEDSIAVFPLPVLDWRFAQGWTLRTVGGAGSGASTGVGGGAEIAWAFHSNWEASLGARLETRRFRLDKEGIAPDGVGDESILPIYARIRWQPCPAVSVGVTGGLILFGELRLEDDNGDRVIDSSGDPVRDVDVDPTPFVGLSASIRF